LGVWICINIYRVVFFSYYLHFWILFSNKSSFFRRIQNMILKKVNLLCKLFLLIFWLPKLLNNCQLLLLNIFTFPLRRCFLISNRLPIISITIIQIICCLSEVISAKWLLIAVTSFQLPFDNILQPRSRYLLFGFADILFI